MVEYRPNPAGIAAMAASPAMLRVMEDLGKVVAAEAERTAAVNTGAYALGAPGAPGVTGGGFTVDVGIRDGAASARVSNDVRNEDYAYGVAQEFGNENTVARHTLGNALDALSTHL